MKKLIAMILISLLVLSSAVYASDSFTAEQKGVDVVAAATNQTPAPAPAPAPKPTPAPAPKPAPAPAPAPAPKPAPTAPTASAPKVNPDAIATASIVNQAAAFEKAISKDGTWIIATLNDLTINKDLVLEGTFHDKNDPKKALKRKIGLYTQDDKHNVIDRFTLTAPKLTILSPSATLQHGTFKGDIYVRAANFSLVDAVVNGNIIFVTQEAKDTFTMDAKSSVTGKQILSDVDAVSTASLVRDGAAFEKAISKDGKWIIATLSDLTIDKDLVVEGEFHDKGLAANKVYRKIGLYTHNNPADKKIATHKFTLTAPSMTIKSPNTSLQYGIFVGDIYVRADNFNLANIKVNGNVYFTTQSAKDTFTMTNSTITGKQILADVDAVSTASITHDADTFAKALSANGNWIICPLRDLTFDKPLVVEGEFHDKGLATNKVYRKIGLYTHNNPADKKIATHSFTLTAPSMTIKSPNTSLQYGTFVGDIYVSANNFSLSNNKVDGNIIFTTQSAKDTFTMTNSTITGKQILADVDAVSTASIVDNNVYFESAINSRGTWIIATLRDLFFTKDLVLEGDFHDKGVMTNKLYRKIGLYTQDDKHNVTRRFTLTAPSLTIKSPNATIQHGTFVGDLYISAPNFKLVDAKVIGNIYFTTKEAQQTFEMDGKSSREGTMGLKLN